MYIPYAWPATGPGHTTLSTGALPSEHGIINNDWPGSKDKKIACDEDTAEKAAVFGPDKLLDYGRSAHNIMVDTLSDQLILQSQKTSYKVFSVSEKSPGAICTAGKLGKAIWLDKKNCIFTSSKAYFDALPTWIKHFNDTKNIKNIRYTWRLSQPNLPAAYQFAQVHNRTNVFTKESPIGKTFNLCGSKEDFMQTPYINQLVFDVAKACIDEHFCKQNQERLFIWILPSALDLVGHDYGPNSIEAIDMIYHLDRQIGSFMNFVHSKTCANNILWALTADHGITPIAEQVKEAGYTDARRLSAQAMTTALNNHLNELLELNQLVTLIKGNSIFVDEKAFKLLDKTARNAAIQEIKKYMSAQPGIKQVLTFSELEKLATHEYDILDCYKNQLFKGRSPRFFIEPFPYNYISTKAVGSYHQSPYEPDRHIPLIIYQPRTLQKKTITDTVYNTQFAPTIAHILGVPRPSACTAQILPGVISKPLPNS